MSVQLILKNSSVADKRPTADQLANGELSLNYNAEGAFLCCVDTAGNIQQLGGVKLSINPPGDPVRGTMWLDTASNSLFVFDGSNWVLIASGTGGGGGGDITSVIGGDGINAQTTTGIVTVSADLNTDQGLHFVSGEIAVNPGANLSFDGQGRLQADVDALSYKGTLDLTAASVPASPNTGDVHTNTETGVISAEWSAATGMVNTTNVVAGDLVAFNGTNWGYIPTGGLPGQGTDLGIAMRNATTLDVTSSSGNDATIPGASTTEAGLISGPDKLKLDGIEDGAEANVQADWLETDSTSAAFIDNKPNIVEQVQSNWDETDTNEPSFIQNKPTIPAAQVQSNWDETDTLEPSFILNKPTIPDPTDPPDTGDYGYWNRTGTVVSPANAGDNIVTTGRIGAGTNAPTRNLVVNGGASEGVLKVTNDTSGTDLAEGLDIIHFLNGETDIHNRTNAALRFSTNNTERARLSATGVFALGDGTTNAVTLDPGTTGIPFVRDSAGRILAGATTAPSVSPNRLFQASTNSGGFFVGHSSADNPTVGMYLGGLHCAGSANGSNLTASLIATAADGNWAAGSAPTRIEIATTPDGSATPVERLRVDSLGRSEFFGAIYAGNFNNIPAGAAWDLSESNIWAFGSSGVINNPDNLVSGTSGLIWVTATISGWGGAFRFPGGTPIAPALNSVVPYFVTSNTVIRLGAPVEGIA